MDGLSVDVDLVAGAAYIQLSEAPVIRTVEYDRLINVDLDGLDMVVGIEVLGAGNVTSFADLAERFQVRSDLVEALRGLPIDLFASAALTSYTAGATKAHVAQEPVLIP